MGRRALAGVLFVLLGLPFVDTPARASSSLEYELLRLVNSGRSGSLPMHSGLQAAARGHSRSMAAGGRLSHSGAGQRVRNAAPDPAESNGAPDDGYTGTFCENIAFVGGYSDGEVAQRIYQGWRNSAGHNRCMHDQRMTAAGVGLYFDGSRWWATLDLTQDRTPPGSKTVREPAAVPAETPAAPELEAAPPTAEATATATPEVLSSGGGAAKASVGAPTPAPPTGSPAPPAVRGPGAETLEPSPAAVRDQLGWPEILAAIGIAFVSIFAYRRTAPSNGGDE